MKNRLILIGTIISILNNSLLGNTVVSVTDSQQSYSEYKHYSEEEIYMLAKIVQCEAGNQSFYTKELVAQTILNRVESDKFPDSIEEVIKQRHNGVYQFSPLESCGSWYHVEPSIETYEVVYEVLDNEYDFSDGTLYFESCQNPYNWHSRNLQFLYKSDSMRFYK